MHRDGYLNYVKKPCLIYESVTDVGNFKEHDKWVWDVIVGFYEPEWNPFYDKNGFTYIVQSNQYISASATKQAEKKYYPNLTCEPVDTVVKQIEKAYKMVKKYKSLFGPIAIVMGKTDKKETYTLSFSSLFLSEKDVNYIVKNEGSRGFRIEKKGDSEWLFHTELRGNENLQSGTWEKVEKLHPDWDIIDYVVFC